MVDAKPIETKELVRFKRHKKKGESQIIQEDETIGYNASKKYYCKYKMACITDGRFITLFYINTAKKNMILQF